MSKECLRVGLSNAASLCHNEPFLNNLNAVTICPHPNIVNFSEIVSLKTMTDHIHGRTDLIRNTRRPHMFIAEMKLYIDYLREQLINGNGYSSKLKRKTYYQSFHQNLFDAIQYYQKILTVIIGKPNDFKLAQHAEKEITAIKLEYSLE